MVVVDDEHVAVLIFFVYRFETCTARFAFRRREGRKSDSFLILDARNSLYWLASTEWPTKMMCFYLALRRLSPMVGESTPGGEEIIDERRTFYCCL